MGSGSRDRAFDCPNVFGLDGVIGDLLGKVGHAELENSDSGARGR